MCPCHRYASRPRAAAIGDRRGKCPWCAWQSMHVTTSRSPALRPVGLLRPLLVFGTVAAHAGEAAGGRTLQRSGGITHRHGIFRVAMASSSSFTARPASS